MNLTQFISDNDGKIVKSPHGIAGQCVSVSSQWVVDNNLPEFLEDTAWDIWQAKSHPEAYDYISNTPDNFPLPGDVVFFNQAYGAGDGHTGVCTNADTTKLFLFEQNDPLGSPAHTQEYTYVDVAGWAHPKGGSVTPEQDFQNCFITQAQRWPTPEETSAWKSSGDLPYHWVQVNAPNPAKDQAASSQKAVDQIAQKEAVRAATEPLQGQINTDQLTIANLQKQLDAKPKEVTKTVNVSLPLSTYKFSDLVNEVVRRLLGK